MSQVVRTMISCPHCGARFPAVVEQIVDVGLDPQAKERLLAGRINMITCPNCGHTVAVETPLVYHDPQKELLILYVPMQLDISTEEREHLIGELTRRITDNLPQEQRKAYLLQPKQAMTIPGMIDMILEADGITAEMREEQREKLRVMEMFLMLRPDAWPNMLQEQAEHIDAEFLQLLLLQAQNAAETGKDDMANSLLALYNFLMENSEAGQELARAAAAQQEAIQQVSAELEARGAQFTRDDLMQMVLDYADDDDRLQALVGLMRPALDYYFFEQLSERIRQAQGEERDGLMRLRDRLSELTQIIDQQTQAVLQRATETLRVILNSEDLDAAIRPRLHEIDDTFFAVLQANLRAAEERHDQRTFERLQEVFAHVLEALRENAPPQIKLINEALEAKSEDEARAIVEERAPLFGPELIELMEQAAADLEAGGQGERAARLQALLPVAEAHIGTGHHHHDHDHDHPHAH